MDLGEAAGRMNRDHILSASLTLGSPILKEKTSSVIDALMAHYFPMQKVEKI